MWSEPGRIGAAKPSKNYCSRCLRPCGTRDEYFLIYFCNLCQHKVLSSVFGRYSLKPCKTVRYCTGYGHGEGYSAQNFVDSEFGDV